MPRSKIIAEQDGFHHLVFVGLKSTDPAARFAAIAHLQAGISALVESADTIVSCAFFGNHAIFEEALHFGFHAVFRDEEALDAIRQHPDHMALMQWFATVANGQRAEINALVQNGVNKGAQRAPGCGLLSPAE